MMIHSDNMATDLVIRTVGTQATNRFLDQQGCKNTRVSLELGRWHYVILGMTKLPVSRANDQVLVSRIKAGQFDNDGLGYSDSLQNNVCGPRDMGLLLERLYLGQVANQSDTVEMLKLMRASTRHFPFGLSLAPIQTRIGVYTNLARPPPYLACVDSLYFCVFRPARVALCAGKKGRPGCFPTSTAG